jgi:glycosyltransferase involved in cell wall biosynthesis
VVHFEWGSAAILYRPLTERWGRPVVISCHGSEVNVRPHLPSADRFTRSLRQSLASAAAVHCVSSAVAAEAHRLGAKPTQTWLIPSAVDTSAFRPWPRPETSASARPLRIVAVGHLRWLKGHEYALAALRVLLSQGIPATLELIGDDPDFAMAEASERERLGAAIRSLDLSSAADVTGGLSHEEVRRRLQKADVLLHLSVSEGCSVAVLEAMACSLPVVVSDHPGVRETVTDGEHGFVVPLRDPYAAAQALRVLAEDPQRRRSMGAAARIRVVQAFDVTAQIDQFVHAYERLAGNPDQPPSPRRHRADAADQSPLPSRLAPPPELRILSLGPWPWMQSYDIVLAAVRRLQDRGLPCRYRIVGAGQLSDALWFARHQFGLESQVEVVQDSTGRYAAHADWADLILDPPLGAGVPAEPGKTLSTAADDLAKRLAATHPHTIPALRADSVQPRVQPVATA